MNKDFYGLPIVTLENAYLRVDALAQAGPRVVRAFVHGISENLFAELPGLKIETPLGDFSMQGGHRLWHAPEAMPRTYAQDDFGLTVEEHDGSLTLTGAVELLTGMHKTVEIKLMPDRTGLTIQHTLTNQGLWPVEIACWAITQLPLGGLAILPQPTQPADEHGLLPNRSLTLWSYARWGDQRLRLHDDYLLLRGEAEVPPFKVGYLNPHGWLGYLRKGVLFVKRFDPQLSLPHPDRNCNAEVYVNHLFLEAESLGPLVRLEPGQSTAHLETWEFYNGLEEIPFTLTGVRTLVKQLGLDQP
jgi:hypothetical protein